MSKKDKEKCNCNCGEECECGCNCNCEDECECGCNCNCGEECECGCNCNCGEECECGCNCNCEDDCECGCGDDCECDCGCEEHHVSKEELKDRVSMLVDAYSTSEINMDNIFDKGLELHNNKKYEEAKECFTTASILGSSQAMFYLGKYNLEGICCNKDLNKAKTYFELSAKLGCSNSIYMLGDIYRYGIGIEKNPERGVALYQTAFDLAFYSKNPDSMPESAYRLGKELLTGEVVEQNVEDGEFLLNMAASMFKDKLEFDSSVQKELDDCNDLLSRIIEED